MISSLVLKTRGPRQTRQVGEIVGRYAEAGDLFLLNGDLGVGKTCLIQGIAQGLEVQERPRSPTFVLVSQYSGRLPMCHVDLYRLDNLEEIRELGLEDYMEDSGICVVEWAQKAVHLFPPEYLSVSIEYLSQMTRRLTFTADYEHYQRLINIIRDSANVPCD